MAGGETGGEKNRKGEKEGKGGGDYRDLSVGVRRSHRVLLSGARRDDDIASARSSHVDLQSLSCDRQAFRRVSRHFHSCLWGTVPYQSEMS